MITYLVRRTCEACGGPTVRPIWQVDGSRPFDPPYDLCGKCNSILWKGE